jgi:protein TonB
MDANKILSADILDIVFDGKNKEYGAYDLRKTYNKRLTLALIITAALGLLIFLSSWIASALESNKNKDFDVKDLTLTEVKKEDKKPLPPPPPKPKLPPPPPIATIKFTPPKVVPDKEVKPDEKPPDKDSIKDTKIADNTQAGVHNDDISAPVTAPGSQAISAPVADEQPFTKVEVEAEFPGGPVAWKRYLEKNLNASTPVDNGAPEGTYTVVVKFVVAKDGTLSDITAETNFGYGMEEEAIKQIQRGPKWTPGIQNGRSVPSYRRQPITFVVEGQ